MFQNPFSFEGRIRRLEFGLSLAIYFVFAFVTGFVLGITGLIDDTESPKNTLSLLLALSPGIYFMWAQGAKRCHDRNNSGWYQLIPFYGFWMLFAEGDINENEYGENPKSPKTFFDPFSTNHVEPQVKEQTVVEPIDDVDEDGTIKGTKD
uniref:DUF805 domain-containing protein n=1 Tax=Pedobacter schmidteae TaxID=2201271 RepID=UPI000EAF2429|nr:DUF805 domain-containing protein [Pedobacter schmidteae]